MIRITLLTLLVAYLSAYAWKDWFRAACWLVLLMAIFEHPDMPKSIGGVPGLNHWNFLFINTVLSWYSNRKKEKLTWEMPQIVNTLFFLYAFFIFISLIRYLYDHSGVIELFATIGAPPPGAINDINEYLINCFKWVLPGMIIFDGCRNRKQYDFAIGTLALMLILLALQVIKAMKLGSLTIGGDALQHKAAKIISNSVGYHRVNISMMMSGAFWVIFCLKELVSTKHYWLLILPSCFIVFLAMALTGGRTGYVTWAILGIFYCLFKWRKYILLAPLMFLAITMFVPSAIERLGFGFSSEQSAGTQDIEFENEEVNLYEITSGRNLMWPLVWKSIKDAPFFGSGREAMQNLGITLKIKRDYGEAENFPHPHNAYLQWLQDNGFVGAAPVFLLYLLLLKYSLSLFRDNSEKIYVVTGGVSLALLLAFLIASSGSQTFYPREGAVAMWVGIGLLLRVYIERSKKRSGKNSPLIDG
ncbi:O-antigen polymerase [Psychromonas ingrahamii 37]|uniref:O-antigen polymerase n=1 Tax=Psychromonas ingrahamii (strain DSM 17664 / CCUG 51855 / 37) TaxID=357804 RepID=A1SS36_PSYIN|nr:O-antigen ligase family protein [Psychromonas ingrahamii]ABM02301.1 O-antigen polymerase [Psychromonas ingrahamii 37]